VILQGANIPATREAEAIFDNAEYSACPTSWPTPVA
jgi:hypothetical protein